VKEQWWGGEFWTDGYFVSTVGAHANEDIIRHYIDLPPCLKCLTAAKCNSYFKMSKLNLQ
jgi:hypothetical protein